MSKLKFCDSILPRARAQLQMIGDSLRARDCRRIAQ